MLLADNPGLMTLRITRDCVAASQVYNSFHYMHGGSFSLAAHKIYGEAHVINAGNFVYFIAMQHALALQSEAATKVFVDEMVRLHRGQGCDIYWRDTHTCPTEEQYNQMVMDSMCRTMSFRFLAHVRCRNGWIVQAGCGTHVCLWFI